VAHKGQAQALNQLQLSLPHCQVSNNLKRWGGQTTNIIIIIINVIITIIIIITYYYYRAAVIYRPAL